MLSLKISYKFLSEQLLFIITLIGVIQAIMVNILKLNLPLLNIAIFATLIGLYFNAIKQRDFFIRYNYGFLFLIFCYFLLLIWGIALDVENVKDVLYHVNVILSLIFAKTVVEKCNIKFNFFIKFLWVYIALSFVIYIFFWKYFATIISQEEGLINLRSSGVPRSYGLLFNPLSNAYFLLISFFLVFWRYEKGKIWIKMGLILSILFCFTRGAYVSLALFAFAYLVYRRKLFIIFFLFLVAVVSYFFVTSFQTIVDSIFKLEDSQGSAQGHVESIQKAIAAFSEHPEGLGFTKLYVESWLLSYGLNYGIAGIVLLIAQWLYMDYNLFFKKKQYLSSIMFTCFLPVTLIIPFHTFNMPVALFSIMMYIFHYKSMTHNTL